MNERRSMDESEFSFDGEPTDEEMEEVIAKLRKLDQDRVNDQQREWLTMYGFPHECSCASDVEEGNVQEVPVCYLGAAEQSFDALRRSRAFLYAIGTSPSQEPATLKALALEAFGANGW
jgi:hypothetical protein